MTYKLCTQKKYSIVQRNSKRIEWIGHFWTADGKTIKQNTEGIIVGKYLQEGPIGKIILRWKDVVENNFIMIQENLKIVDANELDRWKEIMVATMDPLRC